MMTSSAKTRCAQYRLVWVLLTLPQAKVSRPVGRSLASLLADAPALILRRTRAELVPLMVSFFASVIKS